MKLVGLAGRARSGKDTVGEYMVDRYHMVRYAFADPIRDALMAAFLLPPAMFDGAYKEKPIPWLGVSPRRLMQTLGTEWGRDLVCQDVWIRCADRMWQHIKDTQEKTFNLLPSGMVITDVRFDDEADWIRSQGGKVVHIQRDGAAQVEAHKSEAGVGVKESDTILFNNGTLQDLYRAVESLMPHL